MQFRRVGQSQHYRVVGGWLLLLLLAHLLLAICERSPRKGPVFTKPFWGGWLSLSASKLAVASSRKTKKRRSKAFQPEAAKSRAASLRCKCPARWSDVRCCYRTRSRGSLSISVLRHRKAETRLGLPLGLLTFQHQNCTLQTFHECI